MSFCWAKPYILYSTAWTFHSWTLARSWESVRGNKVRTEWTPPGYIPLSYQSPGLELIGENNHMGSYVEFTGGWEMKFPTAFISQSIFLFFPFQPQCSCMYCLCRNVSGIRTAAHLQQIYHFNAAEELALGMS